MKNSLKDKDVNYSKEEIYLILHSFLNAQLELSRRKVIDESTFETPNWALYQAYQAGIQKALLKVKEFLPDNGEKN